MTISKPPFIEKCYDTWENIIGAYINVMRDFLDLEDGPVVIVESPQKESLVTITIIYQIKMLKVLV